MANSNRSPKELKGLIERSKSTTNLYKQKLSQATKSSHNFDQRSVPYSSTNFYTKPIIYDQNIRPKTEIELLNSQIEEQCRLITFYKNRGDNLSCKNQQLEKFSNALLEQRAFRFLKIDPAKVRIESTIVDRWSAHMAKTDYDIIKTRYEEQAGLAHYYKTRGDDYLQKILTLEKETVEMMDNNKKLEESYNDLSMNFELKQSELDEVIKGLHENCNKYKEQIQNLGISNEKKVFELSKLNQAKLEALKLEEDKTQMALSNQIAELKKVIEGRDAKIKELTNEVNAQKVHNSEMNEYLTERDEMHKKTNSELESKIQEIKDLNTEAKNQENEILRLKSEHYQQNNEIRSLKDDGLEKNNKISDLWTKYNEKDEENGKNIAHYNEQARELQSAQTDLESKTIYIGTLNSQLHEKNVVISELYSEIKGKNGEIENLNASIYKKITEYDDLKQANQMKVKECFDLTARLSETEHSNSTYSKELVEANMEIKNLTEDLNRKKSQNSVLTLEKREKTMEVSKLDNENSDKRSMIYNLNAEKEELEKKISEMYILLKKNKDENVAKADFFETQLKQLKKERDDYLGLNKKQNNENINLMERCHILNVKVKDLTEKLDHDAIKLMDYAHLKTLEKNLRESSKSYDELLKELIYYKTYVKVSDKKMSKLNASGSEMNQR